MRIRSRVNSSGTFGGGPFTVFHQKFPGYGSETGTDTENCPSFETDYEVETIIDDPTPSPLCKAVTHDRTRLLMPINGLSSFKAYQWHEDKFISSGTGPLWYFVLSNSNSSGPFGNPATFQAALGSQASCDVLWDRDIHSLYVDALGDARNVNKVQGLVNVLESHDTVSMCKDMLGIIERLRSVSGIWKIVKDLPNLYLGYSFGIAPLIADMKSVTRDIQKWPTTLKRLRDQRQYVVARKSCGGSLSLHSSLSSLGRSSQSDPCDGSWWHGSLAASIPPKRTVTVQVDNSLEMPQGSFKAADAALRRYFANGLASTVWEMVPFSFVVDWFVNTSALMGELDNILAFRDGSVHDSWVTETYEGYLPMVHHRRDNQQGFQYPDYHGVTIGSLKWNHYSRQPYSSDIPISWAGRFGKKQASYSLALLYQSVAKLKSR